MASRGGRNSGSARSPNMGMLLNLERVPALAPKFANKIGKTAAGFTVAYTGSGTSVMVQSMLDKDGNILDVKNDVYPSINLVEFERRVALHHRPSDEDRLASLRRKFELRLEREFPVKGPASGSEADIQAWLGTLSLGDRLALLKSQKDFEKSKSAKGT